MMKDSPDIDKAVPQPSLLNDEDLFLLATIHEYGKEIFLFAEEYDINTFVQPFNEIRNAHEHLMRAIAEARKFLPEGEIQDPERINKNLQQAIGHQYRAFFDACDWLSIRIREVLTEQLKPYSITVKSKAIPEYIDKRHLIEGLNCEIALLRNAKDIGDKNKIVPTLIKYRGIIDELLEINKYVQSRISTLEEFHTEEKANEKKLWLRPVCGALCGATLTIIVAITIAVLRQ